MGYEQHPPQAERAHSALIHAQSELAGIDEARAAAHVSAACSSEAFGATYLAAAASVINSALPGLTGDFVTDATAACVRLTRRTAEAQDEHPGSIVPSLDYAFTSFGVDLAALTPPAETATQVASLQSLVDDTVRKLDRLLSKHGNYPSDAVFKKLGTDLVALGDDLDAAVRAAGLDC